MLVGTDSTPSLEWRIGFGTEWNPSLPFLLRKGIFAEETEGNLDAAIKIYQQIATEGATDRSVVAQAQYRLGVCYQKQGNKEQAIGILNDFLKQFPAEAALGQKARELLAGLGQTPSSSITIRKLSLAADEIYSVSPDWRLVAYKPKQNNNVAIYETGTGKTWNAKDSAAQKEAWLASISPDGRLIAYQTAAHIVSGLIWIARIDGSEAKQVPDSYRRENQGFQLQLYGWSPDGGQLVASCETKEGNLSIGTLDVKTGTMKEIKRWTSYPYLGKVCLSSNGRYLAYRAGAESESRRRISIVDVESATETILIEKEVADVVGWSPGDARLLFLSGRTGAMGLWAISVREGKPSGEPELVRANVGDICPICVTRDGSIYYTEAKSSEFGAASSEYVCLATVDFQTGEISGQPRRVTDRYLGMQSLPVWSKDGQKLMFAVGGGQKRFVAVSLASGEQKEYPVLDVFTAIPPKYVWSPDGAFLLVLSHRTEGGLGIYRYELASGVTEMLVQRIEGRTWPTQPRFSPEGNSFYYALRKFYTNDWRDCVIRRDLRSGNEEVVYDSPEKLEIHCPYDLSPDGKRLAIVTSGQFRTNKFVIALKVRDLSGPETREVVRLALREKVTSLAWTPDGRRQGGYAELR